MDRQQQKLIEASKSISLDQRSKELRKLVMRGFAHSGKGHVGSAMSLIETLRVLYDDIMSYRADEPDWEDRDRLIVSPGWTSIGLYAVLVDKGFFPKEELDNFMDMHSMLGGCLAEHVPGVEATTGACGHGLPIGIGMAIAMKLKNKSQRVYVIIGDGEHGEGSVWEGAICAARHELDNLVIIVDYNKVQCAGPTSELTGLDPLADKWESFGMEVREVNGHDVEALENVFNDIPFKEKSPNVIISHTVMSKGIKFSEDDALWHWKGKITQETHSDMMKSIEES
jgi:transketolase